LLGLVEKVRGALFGGDAVLR